MLEARVDDQEDLENTRLRAEAKQLRADAKRLRAEAERLRAEIRGLRKENLELRGVLANRRELDDPAASGCSMEITAGTSSGHRHR